MKILLTSDNHLGYKEHDDIRKDDTYTTLTEILTLAHTKDVDILLQGGDLFHDNTPSRNTLTRTISILTSHILGDKKIEFTTNTPLNVDNTDINISIPIIAIHGNHDDVSGIFPVSALEILSNALLIDYIGGSHSIEIINVKPVLFTKGSVKVAVYGIGNIKDRRMYRLFKEKKVVFQRPENFDDYVNILMVHQNTVLHGDCDYLPVDFIDDWFDVVVYGHEHEPVMYRVDSKEFTVIQCGSTVRTSLCEGELGDKYVYLFEIGDSIGIERIKLNTVRPFLMESIKMGERVNKENVLLEKVEQMIQGYDMPLVRLRVEMDDTINNNKFGLNFKDRVANYKDILSFTKRKKVEEINVVEKKEMGSVLDSFLRNIDLKATPESLFAEGVKKYTENGDKEVFSGIVDTVVKNAVLKIKRDALSTDMVESGLKILKDEINRENGYVKNRDANKEI